MSLDSRTREQRLVNLLQILERESPRDLDWFINRYHKVNRGYILAGLSQLHELRGLTAYFIDHDPLAIRQQFFMACVLLKAAATHGFNSGFCDQGFPAEAFIYALLSDSLECLDWITHAELAHNDGPKSLHFYTHMWQLLLLDDHATLREMIALGAKKCRKPLREQFATGNDFFSLVLNRDKAALEVYIQNLTKIKSELINRDFFAHNAVICTKLCWLKGIKVEIDHPLVPMSLMPVAPRDHYKTEYEFLLPGWGPPKQGLMGKIKSWINQ